RDRPVHGAVRALVRGTARRGHRGGRRGRSRHEPLLRPDGDRGGPARRGGHPGRARRGRPAGRGGPAAADAQRERPLHRRPAPGGAARPSRGRGDPPRARPGRGPGAGVTGRLPVVAVVGRPNVGKSTFVHRVLGTRKAIVDGRPGGTRDRNFARADWAGRSFFIVDTGGVVEGSDDRMDRAIRQQALAAVEEADVIVFLVDGRAGVHGLDERLAEVLRKAGRPVVLAVNKVDNLPDDPAYLEFWSLGIGEPVPVSAISGKGSGDLLDRVIEVLPPAGTDG